MHRNHACCWLYFTSLRQVFFTVFLPVLLVFRITDTQFKLESLDKDPYALNNLARPLPFRGKPTHSCHFFLHLGAQVFLILSWICEHKEYFLKNYCLSWNEFKYSVSSIAAERSPYAPSPLGRPSSETRPFLSPPTLMDGLPGRLSPRGKNRGSNVDLFSYCKFLFKHVPFVQ